MMSHLLDALHCRNLTMKTPIWLMRQAGRSLPEYWQMRKKHSFLEMCQNPEVAAEVTLLPFKHYDLDAAILFSDILVIPEALGRGLYFVEGKGPILDAPLNGPQDLVTLPTIDVEEKLSYVQEAILLAKRSLKVPLLGFCGAPFTVASYMIEGKSTQKGKKTKRWMMDEPNSFHKLLDQLAELSIAYLKMQVKAGVKAVQIFDSWANLLSYSQFREFSLFYLKKIVQALPKEIPVILFCLGSSSFVHALSEAKSHCISLDKLGNLAFLRKTLPSNIAIQGNFDPDLLYASHPVIKKEVKAMLSSMHQEPGYVFNLGHGIPPDASLEAVKVVVETVKEFS